MRFDLLHPADQLVMIMDRIYTYGMTTTSGGNLSIRDQNGDVWITPSGVDKGSLTAEDMILVKPDGQLIGRHKPSVELPFHLSIYRMRPDLGAILHAHPPTLVAFSLVRRLPDLRLLPDAPDPGRAGDGGVRGAGQRAAGPEHRQMLCKGPQQRHFGKPRLRAGRHRSFFRVYGL